MFTDEIHDTAFGLMGAYQFVAVGIVGSACAAIEQEIIQVEPFGKKKKLMEILAGVADVSGTIIFVDSKRMADFLAAYLSEMTYATTSIHGARSQRERENALKAFASGKMQLLVATSVAGRGLHIPGVRHVINFDLPTTIDTYVHRIGRTGRLGEQGRATSFFDPEQDRSIAPGLIKILDQAGAKVPFWLTQYSEELLEIKMKTD